MNELLKTQIYTVLPIKLIAYSQIQNNLYFDVLLIPQSLNI